MSRSFRLPVASFENEDVENQREEEKRRVRHRTRILLRKSLHLEDCEGEIIPEETPISTGNVILDSKFPEDAFLPGFVDKMRRK